MDLRPVQALASRADMPYNLYFNDDGGHVFEKGAVSRRLIPPKPPNQDEFLEAFKALHKNPEFMAHGGTLAFGLWHRYPDKYDLRHIYLKGNDTVVYQSVRALGFEPILYMYYGDEHFCLHEGMIIDKVVNFHNDWAAADEDGDEDGEQETVRRRSTSEGWDPRASRCWRNPLLR
jgi:hypothetical protein